MTGKYKFRVLGHRVTIRIESTSKKSTKTNQFAFLHKFIFSLCTIGIILFAFYYAINNYLITSYYTKPFTPISSVNPFLGSVQKVDMVKNKKIKDKIVFNGPRNSKKIAFTFDADMTPEMEKDLTTKYVDSYYDSDLINILIQTKTKATLFMSGLWIESYHDTAKNLAKNPLFELGNHTYSHPAFHNACYGLTQVRDDQKSGEIIKTQKLLKTITGFDNKLFRFPGGCYSEDDLDLVSKTGEIAIQWDVAAQDGFNGDTEQIISNVVDNVKNGSIIVMHMNGYPNEPETAHALPIIITALKEKGFEFVTVSELIGIDKTEPLSIKNLFGLNIY